MRKWPTFSALIIGVILLPLVVNAGEWRYSGTAVSQSDSLAQGTGQGTSANYRSPATGELLPRNNMTQTAVRNEFGEPQEQLPSVGEPPISRWRYPDYTVYFERDRVIIAVSNDVGLTR